MTNISYNTTNWSNIARYLYFRTRMSIPHWLCPIGNHCR